MNVIKKIKKIKKARIKNNGKIPRCQRIQNEYKCNLHYLKETIYEIKHGNPISEESFIKCMEFIYREGWGDCFAWQGEVPGNQTLKEFLDILPIKRYGRY